jgi:hypothetical protein
MAEPKNFEEASQKDNWIRAMNEELDQIEKNNTWELVPRPCNIPLWRTENTYYLRTLARK